MTAGRIGFPFLWYALLSRITLSVAGGAAVAYRHLTDERTVRMQEPVSYVRALAEHYGAMGFPPYEWTVNESAPLETLKKPLSAARVALLTSGGISRTCELPWNPDARNDFRLDEIPPETPSEGFQVHDSYYDHSDAESDINTVFPLERLGELAAEGVIGSVAPRHWSGFMGRIYKRRQLLETEAPAFAKLLAEDRVDALVAVPA